jgi:hypothetical protein
LQGHGSSGRDCTDAVLAGFMTAARLSTRC